MTAGTRSRVVSSFTLVKGSLIEETYRAFAAWDIDATKAANLDRLRRDNTIGAGSETWLRDVGKVLNRRFDTDGRDRPLVLLAKGACELEVWKPILLWHSTRDEFLLRDFFLNWLFPAFQSGTLHVAADELHPYLKSIGKRGEVEHDWSQTTLERVAVGLLRIATDFGLLTGRSTRSFASYHLPEASFLYLLHAMREQTPNARRLIELPDWRMFLMTPADVERELLHLHQYKRLGFESAGSIVELRLPCRTADEYARRLVA